MTRLKQLVKLVKRFTDAPSNPYAPKDIAITFGEARIRYMTQASDITAANHVDRSVYAKLMLDAATLAASSLVGTQVVTNESFNLYGLTDVHAGPLTSVARLVHTDEALYTVETRLFDSQGEPIGSGYGTFTADEAPDVDDDSLAEVDAVPEEDQSEDSSDDIAYGSLWRSPVGFIHLN